MPEERKYEIKIVPLDRRTARPIALGEEVESIPPCIVADTNALYEIMDKVNPRRGVELTIPEEVYRDGFIKSFARITAEMYGADVYYRKVGDRGPWTQQKGYLQGGRRVER